jgi:competence protein ComEC
MIFAGIAILTGSILATFFPFRIDTYWLTLLPICLYFGYLNPKWRFIWLVSSSFLWTTGHIVWQLDQRLDDSLNNKRLVVVGEVINIPVNTPNSTRFLFRPHEIQGYTGSLPGLIRLNWRNAPETLTPGQSWRLTVKLKRPHGFQNPGGFDYERWLFANGIHASGYVVAKQKPQQLGPPAWTLNSVRASINDDIQRYCHDCSNTGLIQALAIGFRGNIEDADRLLLQQTGTAHLIAISGLHIGIVAAVFYALGLVLWKLGIYRTGIRRRELAVSLSFIAALLYSLMAGFDLPAQRALLMITVVLISLWSRTPVNLLNSIFTTLVLVLVMSPLSVLSESFWLSFSALFIIALGSVLFRTQRSRIGKLVVIQLLFSLLFIPISVVIFGQVHIASFLANLVAVPLISLVVVPLNFTLLTLFWLPESWLQSAYAVVDGLTQGLMFFLRGLQDIGLQAQPIGQLNVWQIIIMSLILFIILLPRGLLLSRRWLPLLIIILVWPDSLDYGSDLTIAVLDVGMGTSVVVQTRHHSLVYDFGPGNRQGYSLGKWVVLPYLRHQGIDTVDRVVISHSDQDHMGGLYGIQEQLNHGQVYSGTPHEVSQRLPQLDPVMDCHAQTPWMWDGVTFEFLSAGVHASMSRNNRSCVLRIKLGDEQILVSGDIEAEQEYNLLALDEGRLSAHTLIAPHHGSLTSSSESFIQAVNANNVIFTSGYLNRWAFPRPEILQRYLETGAEIFRTDEDGAILIECKTGGCEIKRYRQQRARLWY